jgi:uncharacterized protein
MNDRGYVKMQYHIFEFDDDLIVFDVYRCRPFLIDEIDKAVLRVRAPIDQARVIHQLGNGHPPEAIRESMKKLIDLGLLLPDEAPSAITPEESRFPEVTYLELNIAEDCNLRCTYCIVGQGGFGADGRNGRARGLMSWEVARRSIDLLFKESLDIRQVHIRFFGGEPLLNWPVIQKCVSYAEEQSKIRNKQVSFSVVTNGTLFNEKIIEFLREHHFLVQVSIDGPPEKHDACRVDVEGRGSYQRAVEFLPNLIRAIGTEQAVVRGTIHHNNLDVIQVFEHLRSLGFEQPELRPVMGHDPDFCLTVNDFLRFNEDASELARRLFYSKAGEARQYIALFNPYIVFLMSGSQRRAPCGAGRNMLGISIDGSILPCTDVAGLDHEALDFGNVYTGLNRKKKAQFLDIVDVDNKIGCRKCWARYICGGACASAQLKYEGGLEKNAGLECIWIRRAIELSLWLYARMCKDQPARFYEIYGRESNRDLSPFDELLHQGE